MGKKESEEPKPSAGIIIIARDTNNFLLLHRVKEPPTWSALAGKMEDGESPLETIKREIKEEIGVDASMISNIKILGKTNNSESGRDHYIMIGYVDHEFNIPKLETDENDNYGWFNLEDLPKPLHPRWSDTRELLEPILNLRESFKKSFNKLINE